MEKFRSALKMTATTKMIWIAFVIGMLVIIAIATTVYAINYTKAKSRLANANVQKQQENIMSQENLTNTSKMSEEELKKLNEKELKETEENKKNTTTTKTTKNKYYIKVNYGAQVVTIYTYDKNGNYTVPVKACVCSTGAATPTSGVYRLSWKAVWGKLFGNVWGHYCYQIVGDILFHSVPYMQARNDTLVSAYYDRLGTKDSMGCIRLTTIDAKWIYDNCVSGTQVEFYSSSNPGPLGKPTAKKVSNAPGNLKNWDPTDPDSKNPWKTYKEESKKPNKNNTNNKITDNKNTNKENENTEKEENNTIQNNTVENNTTVENNLDQNTSIENNPNQNNSIENNQNVENSNVDNSTENETITNKPNENQSVQNNTLVENSVKQESIDNKI